MIVRDIWPPALKVTVVAASTVARHYGTENRPFTTRIAAGSTGS